MIQWLKVLFMNTNTNVKQITQPENLSDFPLSAAEVLQEK